mmetsp:Transcript_5723/g.12393  ORF Transcript_5723/g.12393 Transcript_5723/m.12393 type:complete len:122 (+) Transcript_5723:704-1069(+)
MLKGTTGSIVLCEAEAIDTLLGRAKLIVEGLRIGVLAVLAAEAESSAGQPTHPLAAVSSSASAGACSLGRLARKAAWLRSGVGMLARLARLVGGPLGGNDFTGTGLGPTSSVASTSRSFWL